MQVRQYCGDEYNDQALAFLLALAGGATAAAGKRFEKVTLQQLRIYEIFDDTKPAFHDRFRDHALRIMARHGFRVVATWETSNEGRVEFAYLLDWPDEAAMKAAWAAFMADAEWTDIKRRTRGDKPLVRVLSDRTLRPTAYSPARLFVREQP